MQTIVATATPHGRGAVAIVRLSGPEALQIAMAICPGGPAWRPRRASLRQVLDQGALVDEVLCTTMPGPRSYTGEDVVELATHGNPVIVSAVVACCVAAGARLARAGEFTRRAWLNGRLDLVQAEAVGALVAARSHAGVQAARAGQALGAELRPLRTQLLDLAAELEARLDHPGEDLSLEADAEVAARLRQIADQAGEVAKTWARSRRAIQGAKISLHGAVNAGKSSLFNHLVGAERALVSPTPGTTRDLVERTVMLGGLETCFIDTAGERADAETLEAAGQALTRRWTADVDLRLLVVPLDRAPAPELAALAAGPGPWLVVGTFADRPADPAAWSPVDATVSNQTGAGLGALRQLIADRLAIGELAGGRAVIVNQRQHDLAVRLAAHARDAADALLGPLGPAVAAEEATQALGVLGELSGDAVREDVLDRLFARFCIGK